MVYVWPAGYHAVRCSQSVPYVLSIGRHLKCLTSNKHCLFWKASVSLWFLSCRYTYGKPVVGSVKAVMCRRAFQYYWFSHHRDKDICKTYPLMVRVQRFLKKKVFSCLSQSYANLCILFCLKFCLPHRQIKVAVLRKPWTWRSSPSPAARTAIISMWKLKWRSWAQVGVDWMPATVQVSAMASEEP